MSLAKLVLKKMSIYAFKDAHEGFNVTRIPIKILNLVNPLKVIDIVRLKRRKRRCWGTGE